MFIVFWRAHCKLWIGQGSKSVRRLQHPFKNRHPPPMENVNSHCPEKSRKSIASGHKKDINSRRILFHFDNLWFANRRPSGHQIVAIKLFIYDNENEEMSPVDEININFLCLEGFCVWGIHCILENRIWRERSFQITWE